MRGNEKIIDSKIDLNKLIFGCVGHIFDFSKLPSKIVNYLCECVCFINYLSLESELFIKNIELSNAEINIRTYRNELDLHTKIRINCFLDVFLNITRSNIFYVLTEETTKEKLKLNEEMLLEISEDHFKYEYIDNKIFELKEIDLYYSGYHIADLFKRSVINKQVNKYYNENSLEININWGNIGDSGIEYLSDYLYSMSNLHTINLYINNISSNGLLYFCKVLKHLHEIKTINLGGNRITDKGVVELSNNLCYITKLEALYLMKNQIEDMGIIYICDYLSLLNNLKILSINHNFVSNRGYKYLIEKTVKFSQLTII